MWLRVPLALLGAGVACVLYGVLIERRWYRLVRRRLDILPADAPRPLVLLHLSDLHLVRGDRRTAAFLSRLPRPDVTVVTGDLVGEPVAVEDTAAALRPVRGRLASFFVLGSNDHFAPRPLNYLAYFRGRRRRRRPPPGRAGDLVAQLAADGWRHLRNVREEVDLDGLPLEVLGLDDAHIARHDLRVAPRGAPERFGLAVTHSPDVVPELAALGYDLVVAGHTHGGQVRLPLVGALVTNSHLPRRLASGLFRVGPTIVHVSPGLGTSKFAPFRFLCRPEATILELGPRPPRA
ncbi:MAG TPA: metallophosphoesterase [Actinomycetota bacterium]|nr:metallophosphoesterase [Actinomycetota bacterium]